MSTSIETPSPVSAKPSALAGAPTAAPLTKRIRLIIQQVALPKYRVPVFRELASRPGLDFKLLYSAYPGLPNTNPDGFEAQLIPLHLFHVLGQEFMWHDAQWTSASKKNADVCILSWNTRYLSLIPSILRARLGGVKVILWGHGFSKRPGRLRFALMSFLPRLAHALVFYNHTHAERFISLGFDRRKVFVALNALDQTNIQKARQHWLERPEALAEFRRDKGLGDGPVILFVSRLDANNRVSLLVEAAARLAKQRDDLRVVIVGTGEDEPHLKKLIQDKGLERHVLMPGAIYNETDLGAFFMAATAFCYPRNIGLSLLHAFGYGLPVVTGDDFASHNPEIEALRPGENGLLYKDGDPDALAASLKALIDDPALAKRLGTEAHTTATERFTLKNMVDGFENAARYAMGL